MKLCKIYSNSESRFYNIKFNDGLNVVLASITDKSNVEKDTHNLGKTLLISVIDFILLKGIQDKSKYFLTKGGFENLVFFAELQLNNGKFLIIQRGVENPTKISFKTNEFKLDKFQTNIDWDEEELAFDKAKEMLNKFLHFDVIPTWSYRYSLTYFLRTQGDYRDVFKLDKFKGKDKDWKPLVFDLLGFDGKVILQKYDWENEKDDMQIKLGTLQQEAGINIEEKDKIQGLLDIKTNDKNKIEERIDKFNFYEKDKELNKELVDEIDSKLQLLNTNRYSLSVEIRKIENSLLANQNAINIDKLKALYKDVGIYFPDKLVNDYEKLLEFNQSITTERNEVLRENLENVKSEIKNVTEELEATESKKAGLLSYLTEKDSYSKFKEAQKYLAKSEADIIRLDDKLKAIDSTSIIKDDIETKEQDIDTKIKEVNALINEQKHSEIRKIFNSIIEEILNTNALLSIKQNKEGNVEFEANIQNPKDLKITSEDDGMTYRKLLCMAFDLSILIYYAKKSFYRFVYHDGALEALDDRKKDKFLRLIREVCNKHNLQYILTLIDSDLPKDKNNNVINFPDNEICLNLHDKDDSGKLFKKSF